LQNKTVKQRFDFIKDDLAASDPILFEKVEAAHDVIFEKGQENDGDWEIELHVDASGSMQPFFANGSVQQAVERTLAYAILKDANGMVPVYVYRGGYGATPKVDRYEVTQDNYRDFIVNNGISAGGGTPLTESLQKALTHDGHGDLFETTTSGGGFMRRGRQESATVRVRKSPRPTLRVVIGDGAPNDRKSCTWTIARSSVTATAYKFLYVGNDKAGWEYLESLDDDIPIGDPNKGYRLFDNVDSKKVDLSAPTKVFYADMVDELPKARQDMRGFDMIDA
jgi:hypothetical protein